MSHWITEHIDQVSGAAGAAGAVVIDSMHQYLQGAFTKAMLHDGNVILVAIVILTVKAIYGAFAGIVIGKMVAKFSKK
jgi:hypothetical protein